MNALRLAAAMSISLILVGGSAILCGKYMGRNEQEKMQNVFSLNLALSLLIALLFITLFIVCGLFDLTGPITDDPAVRPLFNRYLLGQAIAEALDELEEELEPEEIETEEERILAAI